MGINWQDVFYFTASLVMILTLIISVWLIWLLFIASKLIRNFVEEVRKWSNFKKNIKLKVLGFLLKILGKEDKKI